MGAPANPSGPSGGRDLTIQDVDLKRSDDYMETRTNIVRDRSPLPKGSIWATSAMSDLGPGRWAWPAFCEIDLSWSPRCLYRFRPVCAIRKLKQGAVR